jgi:hypothetical protein
MPGQFRGRALTSSGGRAQNSLGGGVMEESPDPEGRRQDYDALLDLLADVDRVDVTPHILAETSNLASYIAEPAKSAIRAVLTEVTQTANEIFIPGKQITRHTAYRQLGLVDAAIVMSASPDCTLLTADLDLYVAAVSAGIDCVNFNHVRDQYL